MRGYKIHQQGNQWQFLLIPNNNNNQPVARSKMYESEKDCEEGAKTFRKLIIDNHIDSLNSTCITLEEQSGRLSLCYAGNDQILIKAGTYENKQNCRKSVKAIYKFIDEYTLHRVYD